MNKNELIPKIIHYCWFGNNEKPKEVKAIISNWKHILPDYEIIEWNEQNFDINQYEYTKAAYMEKKYAFVTDVVRLFALKEYGGIYMDTDVEVIKPLNPLLINQAFTGCETEKMCVTGTIGAKKNNPWITLLLNDYKERQFYNDHGKVDLTTNTTRITDLTKLHYGWKEKDTNQDLKDVFIYSSDYLCAKSYHTGKINKTINTFTIHHFSGSWKSNKDKLQSKVLNLIKKTITGLVGEDRFDRINKKIRKKN